MKKLGLALGAGGSRGVAHIGFLEALQDAGIKSDYIVGCSMGAVVGGAYAAGVSLETMKEAVFALRLLDLISPSKQKGGMFGTQKMRTLLAKYIGDISFSDLKLPFHSIAVDMLTQRVVEFEEGSLIDAIVASASIPAVFHPLVKDGMRLVDGCVLERVPAMRVKALGADVVVAVDVLGHLEAREEVPGTVGVLLETFDIMDNYRTRTYHKSHKKQIDFWLEAELGNMSMYSLKGIKFAYQKGYELGQKYAPQIKEALEK